VQFVKDVELDTPMTLAPGKTRIRYEPLGVVLIYGSWNYPYVVTLKPICQAITAGNCAIIKPSEMAPNASKVIKTFVETYLDKDCFAVFEGGPEMAMELQKHPFDLICFTGSTQKGKLVAEAAAKNLIPCILELGGKCPAVVDTTADVDFAAAKIAFARFNNSGQTCISTDYVVVHRDVKDHFLERIQFKLKQFYGEHPNGSDEMGKVVTDWHCDRLQKLIKTSNGDVVCGGRVDRDLKYVEPTIIMSPDLNSPIMEEEIFGPLLPVVTFSSIDEVVRLINQKDKPLAVYYFGKVGSNPNRDRLMNETSSGAFVQNEVMLHMVNHEFGFGGVGPSGYGRYGGYEGFKQWSNPKSIMIKPTLNFYPFTQLTPPFTLEKQALIRRLLNAKGYQNKTIKVVVWILILVVLATLAFIYSHQIKHGIKGACHDFFD